MSRTKKLRSFFVAGPRIRPPTAPPSSPADRSSEVILDRELSVEELQLQRPFGSVSSKFSVAVMVAIAMLFLLLPAVFVLIRIGIRQSHLARDSTIAQAVDSEGSDSTTKAKISVFDAEFSSESSSAAAFSNTNILTVNSSTTEGVPT